MAKPSLKLIDVRDPSREALAAAIAEVEVARNNLDDARSAASKAEEIVWGARARLEALRKEISDAPRDESFITSLASGADVSVLDIDRPEAEAHARIEAAEQELACWRRAREAARAEIAPREDAHEWARRRVHDAVSEVVRSVDVDSLIASAERARDTLIAERCRLMQIRDSLPHFSDSRTAVEAFLEYPFLAHEAGDTWQDHPIVAPWRQAHEALHHDCDTPLPAIETSAAIVVLPSNGRE